MSDREYRSTIDDHDYRPIALADLANEIETYLRARLPLMRATKPGWDCSPYAPLYFALDGKVELRRSFSDYMRRSDDGSFVVVLMGEYWNWRDGTGSAVVEAYKTKAKAWLAENPQPPEAEGWMFMKLCDGDGSRKTPIGADEHAQVTMGIARVTEIDSKWNGVGHESGSWLVAVE